MNLMNIKIQKSTSKNETILESQKSYLRSNLDSKITKDIGIDLDPLIIKNQEPKVYIGRTLKISVLLYAKHQFYSIIHGF
jgi:hypothetical protein